MLSTRSSCRECSSNGPDDSATDDNYMTPHSWRHRLPARRGGSGGEFSRTRQRMPKRNLAAAAHAGGEAESAAYKQHRMKNNLRAARSRQRRKLWNQYTSAVPAKERLADVLLLLTQVDTLVTTMRPMLMPPMPAAAITLADVIAQEVCECHTLVKDEVAAWDVLCVSGVNYDVVERVSRRIQVVIKEHLAELVAQFCVLNPSQREILAGLGDTLTLAQCEAAVLPAHAEDTAAQPGSVTDAASLTEIEVESAAMAPDFSTGSSVSTTATPWTTPLRGVHLAPNEAVCVSPSSAAFNALLQAMSREGGDVDVDVVARALTEMDAEGCDAPCEQGLQATLPPGGMDELMTLSQQLGFDDESLAS